MLFGLDQWTCRLAVPRRDRGRVVKIGSAADTKRLMAAFRGIASVVEQSVTSVTRLIGRGQEGAWQNRKSPTVD